MMKHFTSPSLKRIICSIYFIAVVIFLTLIRSNSYAQTKVYANTVSSVSPNAVSSLTGCGLLNLQPCYNTLTVENANNALSPDNATFATVKSYGGAALGISAYSGELEIKFPTDVPAGKTSYVRIDFNADVLNALLGGNLGGLLANVVGNVALGDHTFEIGARNSTGTTVLSGTSSAAFSNNNLRLVKDANGYFYVAITPSQVYDRIYVRDRTASLLVSTANNTKVFYAFYNSGSDVCAQAAFTSFDGTGLTVDALGLGGAGVTNPENAIDANPATFSRISLGALGVAGSIGQNFYYNTLSDAGDDFNLRLSVSSALLNAGVLNNIRVTAYNGNTEVYTQSAANLLGLDLLGLLNGGQIANIPFSPGVPFDRIRVSLSSLLNANLTQTIQVYGISRSAGRPTFTLPASDLVTTCYNSSAALTATTLITNELLWYAAADGGVPLATVAYNGTFNTPLLTSNTTCYVAARKLGCTAESFRVPVMVSVNPAIVFNTTTLNNATSGFAYSKQLDVATGGTPAYSYGLTNGSSLPPGLSLSNSGLISGTTTAAGTYTFSVTATDAKNCTATVNYTLIVAETLALTAGALPDGITGSQYPTQIIPLATGGTEPYIYSASALPPGLLFNPTTREITGTATQSGNYTIPVTVTDANGNTITSNFSLKITDPLVLPSATLVAGTTGTSYTTQIIPIATGGTLPYTYSATGLPAGLSFNPTTREITGTPTLAGTFIIPVTVTDNTGKTVTTNYSITITDPLSLPNASLADGNVGVAYPTQTTPAAIGGVGPYTYVATNLPPGLTFDPVTRAITGTPSQAGNYSVFVTVTDSEGRTASNTYPLKVNGVLSLPPATLANGVVGTSYPTQTLPAVAGGTAPYTYLATNLPPGLNFNTTTREITGTPTLGGTYIVSLTATDANGNKINTDYSINVTVNAPVVAAATVCPGSSATLSVSNLQAGVTYNWYSSTGNNPLATNNTGVFTSPVVNAQTVFYVEAVSGTAVSARTAVTVSINPAANLAVVTTNNQIINNGQSTTLSATTDTGNSIKWFDAATGGTQLATGASFTTPTLTTTTTYFVETITANGCVSVSRVPVTVTVINGGGSTACNTANSQSSGITGICLLCGVSNAGNAIDADPNNFTRITLAVGVGSAGYQQLNFPSIGLATDSIRLNLGLPSGLLDLGVLSGITINVLNGNNVVRTVQLNSSVLNLQVLGGSRFAATLVAGGAYDRVEVRINGLASAVSSLDVYGASVIYPDPTFTAGSQTICSGSTATLTATANGGTTLNWYNAPTGGTLLVNGPSYTTPALTTTTTYYIEVSRAGCANASRIPVTVTVTPVLSVPVLAPIVSACEGATTTLSINNPDPATTYNWYDAATGGTLLFSGATFITPALTATTNYYVEGSQGTCISATRAVATVTVNPRPTLPMVSASASNVSAGQSAILTATSSEAGLTFNWYTSATSTSSVFTGSTYVTPPLTSTTTYFVESVSSNGCTSANRVQITITVDGTITPNPVPCEAAISQANGVTGVALLAGVFNAGLAIDTDTQTASSLVMPVGALGASVYQYLGFGSLSRVGDTVKVLVSSPGRLLSLALLGNAQVTTFNGTTSNADSRFLNNTLLNVQLLNGNTQALITFVPTVPFDGVELRLNSGVVGALSSINLNYAQRVLVAPTVVSANVAGCIGNTALLEVSNPAAGFTYQWFDASGTYLTGKDGVSFTTPTLTANTKYFVAALSASGCLSAKTVVNVTANPLPAAPELLSPNVSTCAGQTVVLQVKNPVAGIVYKWYDAANVYQAGKDGDTFTISNIAAGNTTYSVEATNSCGVSTARATATIQTGGGLDTPVITPAAVTINSGSVAVLKATSTTAGVVFNWYDSPTSTTSLFTGDTFVTPQLSSTTTYYIEATIGGCSTNARASVVVTVIPNGTPVPTPCGAATVSLATGATAGTIGASVINPGLAIDNDVNTGSSLIIPVGFVGGSVYQQLGFTGGLSNVGDTLRVSITSPGKLLSLSVLPSLVVTTFQGAVSNNDGMSLNNPLIGVNLLSDGSGAILTFVPSAKFDGVELRLNSGLLGALTSVNLNYAQRTIPVPTVQASVNNICEGTSAVLSVQNPQANLNYKWYLGTTYQAGKDGPTFTTDASLAAGSYNYTVTATANGCETAGAVITITVVAPPAPPVPTLGNPLTTCIGTPATLSVQASSGVVYNWYDAPTAGNLLVSNNSSFTTSASLAPGIYDYYVEAVNAGGTSCTNPARTKISITVNPSATASDVSINGNTSLCTSGVAVLTASSTTVNNPIFTWYSDAALTTTVFTGPVYTTPAISATTKYYVTVNGSNKCANTAGNAAEVTISINPVAGASDINLSGATTLCGGSSVTLTASSTTVINPIFTWYSDAGLTTVAYVGSIFSTPVLSSNTTYYVTVKGDNRCENTSATAKAITVTVNPSATDADISASGNTTICQGSSTVLSASSSTVNNPVFTWYSDASLTTVAFVGVTFNTPILNVSTTYYVTVKGDNKCENAPSNAKVVTVTVKAFATAADITLNNAQICSGTSAVLMASSLTVTQPIFTWYSDASLTNVVFTGPTFTVPVTTTTNYYVTVRGANKCENTPANAKVVTVTVNPLASTTDIIANNAVICAGSSTTLTASSPTVTNPVFTWYTDAALTNVSFIGATFVTPNLSVNTTYYVTVKGDNKCENAPGNAKVVSVTVNALPSNPIVSTTGTNICAGEATSLSIQNPQAGITYEWYDAATGGNLLFTGTTYTTPALSATKAYYVNAVNATGCNTASARVQVTVVVNPRPNVPAVSANNVSTCTGSSTILIVSTPQSGVVYNWYTTATGGTLVATGTTFTTPAITANVTYYVEGASGSCISTSRTAVNVSPLPVPVAPSSVTVNSSPICSGSTAILTVNNPLANLIYRWYASSSGGAFLAEGVTFTTPTLTSTTTYYVESVALGGCSSPTRTAVTVNVLPVLDRPVVSVQAITSNSITFGWPAISGAIAYEVSTDNGLSWQAPTSGSAGTTFLVSGLKPDQSVTLIVRAKGQIDCQTSANSAPFTGKATNPLGNEIYIPNIFTPNNDGKNDLFLIYGNTIASARMTIYTQWGQLIYQSDNVANGWDGTFKGVNQPVGVYVYIVDVKFADGTSVMKKGTVTLIR
ncbi:Ig-like domain-containing protein [Pedobacter yonginense]|nr:putative Ig domain-containing protein [Pedobacter yonginense]